MSINRQQKRFRRVKGAKLTLLARQILEYDAWRQVHHFAYDLFDKKRVHSVELSLDHHEGRDKTSVEWITAYDSVRRPLPYDFTRPFWERTLSGENGTILEYLDSSIKEMIGQSDIGVPERSALRQELANDLFDEDRSFFEGLPTYVNEYDLTRPPSPIPPVFIADTQKRRKAKWHTHQPVILLYQGISKPSQSVRKKIASTMQAPVVACIRLQGWLYNRRQLVLMLEKYSSIVFAVNSVDAGKNYWRRLSRWLPGRLRKRVRAVFYIKNVKEERKEGTGQMIDPPI